MLRHLLRYGTTSANGMFTIGCVAHFHDRSLLSINCVHFLALQVALSRKSPYVETAHKVSGLMLANHTCMSQVSPAVGRQPDR